MPESLSINTTVSHYRIISKLGEGGMGEVYRARDSRLQRDVAIKVLPSSVSDDPQRLNRFKREACTAGQLNHPNILVVYDIDSHNGTSFIVSELLEGETLRERINSSALHVSTSIDYAIQIARGLAAAHNKGITHRDLKPDNIFITRDDTTKILDFGLAKIKGPINPDDVSTDAPTQPFYTRPGVILGTVGYMSPEQVDSRPADHRSDIFSFGAVLYEMLTGQRAFKGESAIDTMNAIRKETPPDLWQTVANPPPGLERVVTRCLEKRPERRFQSASDLAFALETLSTPSNSTTRPEAPSALGPFKNRERLAWIVAALFSLAFLTVLAIFFMRPAPADSSAIHFAVAPPEKAAFTYNPETNTFSISPDGRHLAFTAISEGRIQLWIRPLDTITAQPLSGTDGASSPFWSPDSRFIAFSAAGKLKRIEASAGGPPQILCDIPGRSISGTWNRHGVILFSVLGSDYGIYRVADKGGAPKLVVKHVRGPTNDRERMEPNWPQFLPDGRRFLYRAWGLGEPHIYVRSLDSDEDERVLLSVSSLAIYSPPGYLLHVQDGTLLAHPFDAESATLTGHPVPLVEQVRYMIPTGHASFWVSENGTLAYQSAAHVSQLVWFDRSGQEMGEVGEHGGYGGLRLSPDGQRVVVSMSNPHSGAGTHDLWIYDLTRNTPTRFTTTIESDDTEWWPIWSPDGQRIVFATDVGGPPHLYQKGLGDTSGGVELLRVGGVQIANDWSPDGRFIIYEQSSSSNRMDLWVLPLFGERQPYPFLQTQSNETQAQFSPDGRWIAYVSDESGSPEVYVQSFENPAEKWRISTDGGARPRWRSDGSELFYISADNKLMVALVRIGASFRADAPSILFRVGSEKWIDYDVTADGRRFLSNIAAVTPNSLPIAVVVNWREVLKP